MPFTFKISTVAQICHVIGFEDLTVQSSAEAMANVANHPDFQSHYGVVSDFLQVTNMIHQKEMRNIASALHGFKDSYKGRIALVVNPAEVRKASTVCMLVRLFGVKMEAYGDVESGIQYVTTGNSWLKNTQ